MADSHGLPSNQWSATDSEISHKSSSFAPLLATHDVQDVSFSDRINKAKSIWFSSKFMTYMPGASNLENFAQQNTLQNEKRLSMTARGTCLTKP
jgi:hypothetical protein